VSEVVREKTTGRMGEVVRQERDRLVLQPLEGGQEWTVRVAAVEAVPMREAVAAKNRALGAVRSREHRGRGERW
jgi:hypothetical protein